MWPFEKKGYTGKKVLITNKINGTDEKKVYDLGSGPFIYNYIGTDIRYLTRDGGFEVDNGACSVNGDAVSWRKHLGETDELNWDANDQA